MSSRKPLQCPRCGSTEAEFTATQARHGEQSYIVTMGDDGLLLEPVSYDIYDIRRTLMLGCGDCRHSWPTDRPVEDWNHRED